MPDQSERRTTYEPDYVFPPGDHMREKLAEMGMSQAQFAWKAGLSQKHVSQVLNGKVPLSVDVADRFEWITGMSARLLLNIEAGWALSEYRRTHVSGPAQLEKAHTDDGYQPLSDEEE